jgi:hypothetical protein
MDGLDQFFGLLTTPGSAISLPISALADPSHKDRAAETIHRQHGILRAQSLSADCRRPLNASGTVKLGLSPSNTASGSASVDSFLSSVNATVTDPQGRTRLIQDPTSTRALQALLGGILLLSVVGWASQELHWPFSPVVDKRKAIAQDLVVWGRSPTCIADVMALLACSNLFEVLPMYYVARRRPRGRYGRGVGGAEVQVGVGRG